MAGLVPMHLCLPKAHPEAPSPVSAMLSAAMVNLGVYGTVRFGFDLLGGGAQWWWLVILVVSRDIMIVSAVILSWVVDKPVPLKPLLVSKLNTVAQIVLACVVMAALGFDFDASVAIMLLTPLVAALTLLSVAFYVAEWVRHMNTADLSP